MSQQGDIYRDNYVIPSSWRSEEIKRCYVGGLRCQWEGPRGFWPPHWFTSTCCSQVILESFIWKSLDCGRKPSRCFPSAPLKHCLALFFKSYFTLDWRPNRIRHLTLLYLCWCGRGAGGMNTWHSQTDDLWGVSFFSYSLLYFLWRNFTPHHWGFKGFATSGGKFVVKLSKQFNSSSIDHYVSAPFLISYDHPFSLFPGHGIRESSGACIWMTFSLLSHKHQI